MPTEFAVWLESVHRRPLGARANKGLATRTHPSVSNVRHESLSCPFLKFFSNFSSPSAVSISPVALKLTSSSFVALFPNLFPSCGGDDDARARARQYGGTRASPGIHSAVLSARALSLSSPTVRDADAPSQRYLFGGPVKRSEQEQ